MAYKVIVRENWCKGCYICISLCPKNVFEKAGLIDDRGIIVSKAVRPEDCIWLSPLKKRMSKPLRKGADICQRKK
jgi:2-oxoglutarate ferredoxin oxidoreductase subunit delta